MRKTPRAATDGGQDATVVVDASLDADADASDAATDAPLQVRAAFVLLDGARGAHALPSGERQSVPLVPFTSYYHLDNLEDGGIKKPGLTALGVSTLSSFSGSIMSTPSTVTTERSATAARPTGAPDAPRFTGNSAAGIEFQFNEATLGALPTHAGLVWTDGLGNVTVTFSAFGADGGVLVSYATSGIGDGLEQQHERRGPLLRRRARW